MARSAQRTYSGIPKAAPACANAEIISAFHAVSTFSSRPGQTRSARTAYSFALMSSSFARNSSALMRFSLASCSSVRLRHRMLCPSKLPAGLVPNTDRARWASSGPRTDAISSSDQT